MIKCGTKSQFGRPSLNAHTQQLPRAVVVVVVLAPAGPTNGPRMAFSGKNKTEKQSETCGLPEIGGPPVRILEAVGAVLIFEPQ